MIPKNENGAAQKAANVDVVVIGGGAAGLNGALILARSRRTVVVVDAGEPRNAPADAVHGLFALDGTPPDRLLARGREEVRRYGGEVVSGEVTTVERSLDGRFEVTLTDGSPLGARQLSARRLLVASGLTDVLPDVPGLSRLWGRDVVHCPYCHGYEVRDKAIGVLAVSAASVHHALLFRQLSSDIIYFSHETALDAGTREQFDALGIEVVSGQVAEAEISAERLRAVRMTDGRVIARDVIAVGSRLEARASFLADIGLLPSDHPSGMGHHIPSDDFGASAVPGVWVAGNVTNLMAQVGAAAAGGATAAAHLNADLVAEDAREALERHRSAKDGSLGGRAVVEGAEPVAQSGL